MFRTGSAAVTVAAILLAACVQDGAIAPEPAPQAAADAVPEPASASAAEPAAAMDAPAQPAAPATAADPEPASCALNGAFDHVTRNDGTRRVIFGEDGLMFRSDYAVNTDGAPTSYHPDDPWGSSGLAINTVCNGVDIAAPEEVDYSQCKKLIDYFAQARDAGWTGADSPIVNFYGIATKSDTGEGRHQPCINDDPAYKGYFVSTTSQLADPSRGRCDQGRYLNSLDLPFIIRPRGANFSGNGVDVGDLALVMDPASGRQTFAIVGDIGPSWGLGEGSVYVSRALTGKATNPKTRKEVYGYGARNVLTLVFTGAPMKPPYTPERIEAAGKAALERFGGQDRFNACAAELD